MLLLRCIFKGFKDTNLLGNYLYLCSVCQGTSTQFDVIISFNGCPSGVAVNYDTLFLRFSNF